MPTPFIRVTRRPASGLGATRIRQIGSRRRRRASLSIARAPSSRQGEPQFVVGDRRGESGGALARRRARRRGRAMRLAGRGERPLAERDAADAAPAEMGVDALDDDRRGVLRLERERRVDAQHQRRRRDRIRVLARAARRPLDLRRLGVARDVGADDVGPVGDQAHLAEAARGERRRDDAGEQRPDLRRLRARLADRRFLHRAAAASLSAMDASLAPRRAALKPQPARPPPARLVGRQSPRPAVARRAGRDARSLSRLAVGSPAAADDRRRRRALLRALPPALAAGRGARRRFARRGDRGLRRARLLRAGAQSPRLRPGDCAARRPLPRQRGGLAGAAGRRRLHRGGGGGDRLRRKGRGGRRQRRAHHGAAAGAADAVAAGARGDRRGDGGACPRRPAGRLRPGADGPRRDGLPAAQSRLRRLPAERRLRGGARRRARILSAPRAPPRRGRSASAPPISPSAATAPSSPAAGRPRACSARRSNCRGRHGGRPKTAARARRGRSRRAGGACRAKSSRSSPISRCG